jgi:mRNA interferase MazF
MLAYWGFLNSLKGNPFRMAITFHPRIGQLLVCDFSKGFKEPEMIKSYRPVVVVSQPNKGRPGLVTVVALGSRRPDPIMEYHLRLPKAALPQLGQFQVKETWLKGDMIYSVGFHRLDLIKLGKRDARTGKRLYFKRRLGRENMKRVYQCVLHGLNLGALGKHL